MDERREEYKSATALLKSLSSMSLSAFREDDAAPSELSSGCFGGEPELF